VYGGNPIWEILELECFYELEANSGQMLINKGILNVKKGLVLAMSLQKRWELYSRLVPDSFDLIRLSFAAVSVKYSLVPHLPALMGHHADGRFCGQAEVQFYPRLRYRTQLQSKDLIFTTAAGGLNDHLVNYRIILRDLTVSNFTTAQK
jgi:hypothetical protein